ncbi:MAG: DUF447 domain-containing protein [Promethearchaeota archaeon]|jgi:hypothetical protein
MKVNYQDIGLHKNYLYEVLTTTFSRDKGKLIPNTASMGIRLIEDDIIRITPYPNTTTFKNLKGNGYASINFIDNIHLFTLASLKDPNSSIGLREFPIELYGYYEFMAGKDIRKTFKELKNKEKFLFPYINKAWAIAFCEVIEKNQTSKENSLGKLILSEFKLRIYSLVKKRESFKLFNRAENLMLESLILATRLKLAKEIDNEHLFEKIYEKIIDHLGNIERFSKNRDVHKSLELLKEYISKLRI